MNLAHTTVGRRQLLAGTAAGGAALALAACGGGSESADGSVTITMVESITSSARTELLKSLIADFEAANEGITVELVSPPTEQADQKIQQMLQAGSGVDVLEVRDLTIGPFTNNSWLYDMTAETEGWDGFADLTDQAKAFATSVDGKTFAIPYGFYGLSLYYRPDLIAEAGFDGPPATWEELVEQAAAVQDPSQNRYGYAFRGTSNSIGQAMSALEAYNAEDIDPENAYALADGSTIFSSPASQEALDMYIELFRTGSPQSAVAWGYPEMVEAFTNGSTAFLLQDPEVIAAVEASSLTEDQWAVAPLVTGPTGKATWPMATAGWGVAESSEHKEAAVKLVQFLSGDASTTFAKENSLVPILQSAGEDEHFKTGPWAAYVTMTEAPETYLSCQEPRGVAWWTEWGQRSDTDMQMILTDSLTTADALKGWDEFWSEKWEG